MIIRVASNDSMNHSTSIRNHWIEVLTNSIRFQLESNSIRIQFIRIWSRSIPRRILNNEIMKTISMIMHHVSRYEEQSFYVNFNHRNKQNIFDHSRKHEILKLQCSLNVENVCVVSKTRFFEIFFDFIDDNIDLWFFFELQRFQIIQNSSNATCECLRFVFCLIFMISCRLIFLFVITFEFFFIFSSIFSDSVVILRESD